MSGGFIEKLSGMLNKRTAPIVTRVHRIAAIAFPCVAISANSYGRLADIAPVRSPGGAYAASLRLLAAKNLRPKLAVATPPGTKFAALLLHDGHTNEALHQVTIPDADDTDDRNAIDLSWSPDGRALIVQVQIGQLSQFTLYRVVAQRLVPLQELPKPKRLVIHSEHQKSRGGIYIQRWAARDTFVALDTVSDAEYTYRITKQWKLETIASKAIQP
jgi:hypothetical protein